jgi:hypothetical protein
MAKSPCLAFRRHTPFALAMRWWQKKHYHKKQQARVSVEFEISRIGTRILARRPA